MVSKETQRVIKEVFSNSEIDHYAENEATVTLEKIYPHKLKELIEKTSIWSGCDWHIEGATQTGGARIIFKHTANVAK